MVNPRNWSIRTRSLLLLLATLLPLPVLGGYWVITATQREHSRLEHEARELAALVAAQVDGRMDVVHEMLAVLAACPRSSHRIAGRPTGCSELSWRNRPISITSFW
jgi:hypothetical protein